jgi:hypothetical protein
MYPINFPEANFQFVLAPAAQEQAGEFHDSRLYGHVTANEVISCWELTDEDIQRIKDTRQIWLRIVGGQPPVELTAQSPFYVPETFEGNIEENSDEMSDDTNKQIQPSEPGENETMP